MISSRIMIRKVFLWIVSVVLIAIIILLGFYFYIRWGAYADQRNGVYFKLALAYEDIARFVHLVIQFIESGRLNRFVYLVVIPPALIAALHAFNFFRPYSFIESTYFHKKYVNLTKILWRDKYFLVCAASIMSLYQISHTISLYQKFPLTPVPYASILKMEPFYKSGIYSNDFYGLIWYYSRGWAGMVESVPPLDFKDGYLHLKDNNNIKYSFPDYFLCDNTNLSFLRPGGFIKREPYIGFAAEFDGKNCLFIAQHLESMGYKTIVQGPQFTISKFRSAAQ